MQGCTAQLTRLLLAANRLISRDGRLQVHNTINRRSVWRSFYAHGLFTTLIDAPWPYVLAVGTAHCHMHLPGCGWFRGVGSHRAL